MNEWAESVAFWVSFGLVVMVTLSSLIMGTVRNLGLGVPGIAWFAVGVAGICVCGLFLLSRFLL